MRDGVEHKALAIGPDVRTERDPFKDLVAVIIVRDAIIRANPEVSGQTIVCADDYVPVRQPCIDPEEIVPYVKMVIRDVNLRRSPVGIFLWEVRRDAIVFVFAKKL